MAQYNSAAAHQTLFVKRFLCKVQATLLDAVMDSGLSLEEIATKLDIEERELYDRLMESDDISLRFMGELFWAVGVKPELVFAKFTPEQRKALGL